MGVWVGMWVAAWVPVCLGGWAGQQVCYMQEGAERCRKVQEGAGRCRKVCRAVGSGLGGLDGCCTDS